MAKRDLHRLDFRHKEEYFFPAHAADEGWSLGRVAREDWGPRFRVQRASAGHNIFIYLAGGAGTLRCAEQTYALHGGMAFLIQPGQPHAFWCEPSAPLDTFIITFRGRLDRHPAAALFRQSAAVRLSSPASVLALCEEAIAEARSGALLAHEVCLCLLQALLYRSVSLRATARAGFGQAQRTFADAKSCLDRQFSQLRSPVEVARHCHIDPSYLCRLFQRFAQTSPHQYLLRLKMSRAAHLLATTDHSVKEIARSLAFPDGPSFSRAFRRALGVSPRQYRQAAP